LGAQRKLQRAMAGVVAKEPARAFELVREHRDRVSEQLRRCFPTAQTVLVLDWLSGYRPRLNLHCLLVEIVEQDAAGKPTSASSQAHIVKVVTPLPPHVVSTKDPPKIDDEWEGFRRSRPPGMLADSLLASLSPLREGEETVGLLYGDVGSVLGAGRIDTLEGCLLSCVRHGTPTLESLAGGMSRIYGTLFERFYAQSYTLEETQQLVAEGSWLHRKLTPRLEVWKDQPNSAICASSTTASPHQQERLRYRRETLVLLDPTIESPTFESFLDPVDYLRPIFSGSATVEQRPRMRFGCAHGDLHGRNALVGLIDDEVGSIGIFDFDDVAPNNLLVWDFVKLETEFKIRAYPIVFSTGTLSDFAMNVHTFELELAKDTENYKESGQWQRMAADVPPARGRLMTLLRSIRTEAERSLGRRLNRLHEWLEEYYFGLACYGVQAMTFENVEQYEEVGAYISAGTAASRLSVPWRQLREQVRLARAEAQMLMASSSSSDVSAFENSVWNSYTWSKSSPMISFHPKAAFALEFTRRHCDSESGKRLVQVGRKLMEQLHAEFPHALVIEQEIALVWMELGGASASDDVERLLDEMSRRCITPVDETLCRQGRRYKDLAFPDEQFLEAKDRENLRVSLDSYRLAFSIRNHYYPGINVAAMQYLLGDEESARRTVETFLADISLDGTPWPLATRGDAYFLLGRHDEAKHHYRLFAQHKDVKPQNLATTRRQLERLLHVSSEEIKDHWQPEILEALFSRTDPDTKDQQS
jgi:tetratricopeptide (TPR) repeat protein